MLEAGINVLITLPICPFPFSPTISVLSSLFVRSLLGISEGLSTNHEQDHIKMCFVSYTYYTCAAKSDSPASRGDQREAMHQLTCGRYIQEEKEAIFTRTRICHEAWYSDV